MNATIKFDAQEVENVMRQYVCKLSNVSKVRDSFIRNDGSVEINVELVDPPREPLVHYGEGLTIPKISI